MADDDQTEPWFRFTIEDPDPAGIEIPRLARLLADLSSAFYVIARAKIGKVGRKPGRRAIAEDVLAGARVVRVQPGSATIELAPPPAEDQPHLPGFDEPTPDDVAYGFYDDVERIRRRRPPADERWDVRRFVRAVIEDAGQVGTRARLVYRPRLERLRPRTRADLTQTFSTELPPEEEPERRGVETRIVSGHAYMVDVEPGRERLRVKLPDGRDMTVDVETSLAPQLAGILDRIVELAVAEEAERDKPQKRIAHDISVVPSGVVTAQPPSIAELEREQGLSKRRPDYVALASLVWRTKKELANFEEHLRLIRHPEGT